MGDRAQVSVLVAMPHEESAFQAQLPRSDYLRKYRPPEGGGLLGGASLAEVWAQELAEPLGVPLGRLCQSLAARGFDVVTRATLRDLSERAIGERIVVVLAHWKGAAIAPEDVQSWDRAAFDERLEGRECPLSAWMRGQLRPTGRRRWWPFAAPLPSLVDVLNDALDTPLLHPRVLDGSADEVVEHPDTRQARRRDLLDEWFRGLLQPGNRLELDDGLHSADEVDAAITPGFRGVIDLSTCTSSRLADVLSSRRRGECRTVHFTGGLAPLLAASDLELALALYEEDHPYLDARRAAFSWRRENWPTC